MSRRSRNNHSSRPLRLRDIFIGGIYLVVILSSFPVCRWVYEKAYEVGAHDLFAPINRIVRLVSSTVGESAADDRLSSSPDVNLPPVSGQERQSNIGTGGEPLPDWQKKERVNVLLLGIDERADQHGPWRTDTMIVLTIDPENNTAGILSIPRDLWVPIPGYGENRINTAHYTGDLKKYPGGGPALAIKTVQYNLGIPIHYYVRVNFGGFVEAVDTIGGVDIYVEKEIDDPLYPDNAYGYDPLYIPAGLQHMDGELALKYARTRHGGSDFDRLRRQQQVIMAVRDKVLRFQMLPQLLPKLPELLKTMGDSVQTDLQLDEMLNLAQLASRIDDEHLRSAVIGSSMTVPTTTPNGAQVLIPIRDEIRAVLDEIFAEPVQVAEEEIEGEIEEDKKKLAEEGAKIIVHNGSTVGNLAARTSAFLKERGFQVVEFGNAERFDYPTTIIVDYTGKEYTIQYLARLLNIPQNNIQPFTGSYSEIDIRLIIGADFQPPTAP
jgi:LCP family protein required for cell wall assembly